MKKDSRKIARTSAKPRPVTPAQGVPGYEGLVGEIGVLLEQARRTSARALNAIMTATYWEIGRRIVEHEQQGKARAEYGEALLERLAGDSTSRYGRGFGVVNLSQMKKLYLLWPAERIFQTPSEESLPDHNRPTPSGKSGPAILQTLPAESSLAQVAAHSIRFFSLSRPR